MSITGYSFAQKKKVAIVSNLVMKKFQLKNGRTTVIATGKSKKGDKVSTIVSNEKLKECKDKRARTPKGAHCSRK
jgi:hypothetical protein